MKTIVTACIVLLTVLSLGNTALADDTIIRESSSSESIENLQTVLSKIGAYDGSIDGEYSSVEATIIKLQIELAIISSADDEDAGIVDSTFLNRVISVYKETPERRAEIAEKRALDDAIAKEAENKRLNDAKINASNIQNSVQAVIQKPDVGERKFIVTAYYSPLPGQKKYATGSYWGDIRLNGEGTHGASGAGVYYGFIAAPQNYPFGTKIWLEGFGNGVVEDRGGAIVNAGRRGFEYDRLDIWMGYGDAGLTRALNWGKKTVNGKILGDGAIVVDSYTDSEYYTLRVTPNSNGPDVEQLQELLKKLGKYNGSIDGNYKSVENALIQYQIDNKIIGNKTQDGAGYFGPKTYAVAQKALALIEIAENVKQEKEEQNAVVAEILKEKNEAAVEKTQTLEEVLEEITDKYPLLSEEEEAKLTLISDKIGELLEIKASGNRVVLEKSRSTVLNKLEDIREKTNNDTGKQKIQFIIANM